MRTSCGPLGEIQFKTCLRGQVGQVGQGKWPFQVLFFSPNTQFNIAEARVLILIEIYTLYTLLYLFPASVFLLPWLISHIYLQQTQFWFILLIYATGIIHKTLSAVVLGHGKSFLVAAQLVQDASFLDYRTLSLRK